MATNRTINFYGYAYGDVPVQLNAHINGELVFSGAVPTLSEPIPDTDGFDMTNAPILFSVPDSALFPVEFAGTYPLTMSVATGSGVLQCNTFSNYMLTSTKELTPTEPDGYKWIVTPGTADVFSDAYNGIPVNSTATTDSRSSVFIDGVAMTEDRATGGAGQWTIEVPAGSTMSCDFTVALGNVAA
jgi:hypothetical protein